MLNSNNIMCNIIFGYQQNAIEINFNHMHLFHRNSYDMYVIFVYFNHFII